MGHHRPAQRNAIEMAYRSRADDVPLNAGFFQGIRTSIAKKPYIFVIFQGGSGPPVPPSGSANVKHGHSWWIVIILKETAIIIQITHFICMLDAKAAQNSILNKKKVSKVLCVLHRLNFRLKMIIVTSVYFV